MSELPTIAGIMLLHMWCMTMAIITQSIWTATIAIVVVGSVQFYKVYVDLRGKP